MGTACGAEGWPAAAHVGIIKRGWRGYGAQRDAAAIGRCGEADGERVVHAEDLVSVIRVRAHERCDTHR